MLSFASGLDAVVLVPGLFVVVLVAVLALSFLVVAGLFCCCCRCYCNCGSFSFCCFSSYCCFFASGLDTVVLVAGLFVVFLVAVVDVAVIDDNVVANYGGIYLLLFVHSLKLFWVPLYF